MDEKIEAGHFPFPRRFAIQDSINILEFDAHVTLDSFSAKLAKRLFERSLPVRYSLDLGRQFVVGERYEENLIYACQRPIDRSCSLLTVEEQPESLHFNAVLYLLTSERV